MSAGSGVEGEHNRTSASNGLPPAFYYTENLPGLLDVRRETGVTWVFKQY